MLRALLAGLLSTIVAVPLAVRTASAKSPGEIFQDNRQAIVQIEMAADPSLPNHEPMIGSGFIINPDGFVLTASHNLNGYISPQVTPIKAHIGAMNGLEVGADLISTDRQSDIAILKLRGASAIGLSEYQPVTQGDSSTLASGDALSVVGFRLSTDIAPVQVSFATQSNGAGMGPKLWTINAPGVVFGMSGAPVFNADGAVIGMVVGGWPEAGLAFIYPVQFMLSPIGTLWQNPRCDAGPLPMQYSLYVIDNTSGVTRPDQNGQPMIETIRSTLLGDAKRWDERTQCFGGVAIGGGGPPVPAAPATACGRVAPFHSLARFNFARLEHGLQALVPKGDARPLVDGIITALQAYQPYRRQYMNRPNDRFAFTIITTGPDTCGYDDPAKFLDALDSLLSERERRAVFYDNRTLSIMLKLADKSDSGAGYTKTLAYRRPDQPLAILIVKDNEALETALAAIAEIISPDRDTRNHGCEGLIGLFKKQEDDAGVERVSLRCRD